MKVAATREFNVPQEKVFAALIDPAILQKCIDGCEKMEKTGEDSYDAHLKIGVAGIKGSYVGKIRVEEKKPPESFTLQVEGKGSPGWVKGKARIRILPKGEGSELQCESEGQVGGLIAQVGSRLVEAVAKKMQDEFAIKNVMAVPKVEKVVLNMGLGEAVANPKIIEGAVEELSAIAGQKAVVTKAKKAIATYKLRAGMPIGARVTLRGDRMFEFLDRLINIALPRVRDFRGVSTKAFDGRGNYTLGIRDHFIFPEIDYSRTDKSKGLNVTIVTTAGRDDRARALLQALGMPFGR